MQLYTVHLLNTPYNVTIEFINAPFQSEGCHKTVLPHVNEKLLSLSFGFS